MPFKVIPFLKLCEFSGVNSTFGEGKHYTISCLTVFQCDFQHLRIFIWSQSMTHLVTTPPPRGKKSNLGRNPVTFAVENSAQKPTGNGEIKQKARKRERETEMFSVSLRFPSDFPYTKKNKKKWFHNLLRSQSNQVLYPTIDSISELFPLLCVPIAAIRGKLMYRCNLGRNFMVLGDQMYVTLW